MARHLSLDLYNPFCEFSYRGEGNANLVIAHHTKRIVIRFRKSLPEQLPSDGGLTRVAREVGFSKKVMLKLFGTYIDVPKVVYYDQKSLEKLFEKIQVDRPSNRLFKSVLEEFATQLPDYSVLIQRDLYPHSSSMKNPVFCVEIKPKQGYVCKIDQVFPKCPYCLKQFYKSKTLTHKIKMDGFGRKWFTLPYIKNAYCPLELFSGNPVRMKQAMTNLMDNPQNNLKIFRQGLCLYDENSSGLRNKAVEDFMDDLFSGKDWMDLLSILLVKTLLCPFLRVQNETTNILGEKMVEINSNINVPSRIDPALTSQATTLLLENDQTCNFAEGNLPPGCVLERIIAIQKLHQHGEDIVYSIYSKYRDVLNDEDIYSSVVNRLQERYGFLLEDNDISDCNGCTCIDEGLVNYENKSAFMKKNAAKCDKKIECKYPSASELFILQNYLLFSTIRDCSIMVAIEKLESGDVKLYAKGNVISLSEHERYLVNVKISDVDLKNVQCIEKHRKRDEKIMNAVISTFA